MQSNTANLSINVVVPDTIYDAVGWILWMSSDDLLALFEYFVLFKSSLVNLHTFCGAFIGNVEKRQHTKEAPTHNQDMTKRTEGETVTVNTSTYIL